MTIEMHTKLQCSEKKNNCIASILLKVLNRSEMDATEVSLIIILYLAVFFHENEAGFENQFYQNGSSSSAYKIVNTKNGAVRGYLTRTILNHKLYYAFKGIPFAKPPVSAKLRFKVCLLFTFIFHCVQKNSEKIKLEIFARI